MKRHADVAICGAGPVGLLLAGELASHGLTVDVFERADERSTLAKANGIVGHAAVELAKRRVLAGTSLRVVSPPRFQFGPLQLNLGFGPGNPLHVLPIPQRRLEDLLERRAIRCGADLRYGHELSGITQTDDHVSVSVRVGQQTTVHSARFLVGCDGASSFVRKYMGIAFSGFTSDQIDRIARVTIPAHLITPTRGGFNLAGVGEVAAMRTNLMQGGGTFSIASAAALDPGSPADLYLISTHEHRGIDEANNNVSSEELRASLRRVLGTDLDFTDATDVRSTVGNSRVAESFRVGNVFLAGDAAHVFNAGGSALNIGLQDALDLADRLTTAFGTPPHPPLHSVDAYEPARRHAAERALRHTRAQAALSQSDPGSQSLHDTLADLVTHRSTARRLARLIEDS